MKHKYEVVIIAIFLSFFVIKAHAASGDLTVYGNVGIGTNNPTSYKLYILGTAYATGYWQSSDLTFKENVAPIESPLQRLINVNGISFTWKKQGNENRGFPDGKHNGFIAQDIEKIFPEIVREGQDGEKAVAYTELIPILIEAMKEQQKIIEKQQSDMKALMTAIEEIRAKNK